MFKAQVSMSEKVEKDSDWEQPRDPGLKARHKPEVSGLLNIHGVLAGTHKGVRQPRVLASERGPVHV